MLTDSRNPSGASGSLATEVELRVPAVLRRALGSHWEFTHAEGRIAISATWTCPSATSFCSGTPRTPNAWQCTSALGSSDWRGPAAARTGTASSMAFAGAAPPCTLDAIRTATLLLGHGITPAPRGAGGITRRVIHTIATDSARLGVSALVRASYEYWGLFGKPAVPWPEVVVSIEHALDA